MIKVAELKDERLDYWAAKADGKDVLIAGGMAQILYRRDANGDESYQRYSPSTDWSQGGPIIELLKPTSFYYWKPTSEWTCAWGNGPRWRTGPTALIAAMRCFVASKFGEEVDEGEIT